MGTKLYIGNLSFSVNESSLEAFFKDRGIETEKIELVRDVSSGKSRGFGFVQLAPGQELEAAIEQTNGKDLEGRNVIVNEARERTRSSGGGGGGGRDRDRGRGGRHGGGGRRY
ncbi:MAG TPA: RNA-binding protein [Acidobacteriota bacterium]|jgi:RNA recognition motif-containing protein